MRLAERATSSFGIRQSLFQFQIGAIGSLSDANIEHTINQFQFQIGAIGSGDRGFFLSFSYVSIPDWCDWQTFDDSKKLANSQYINFCKNSVFFLKSCRTPKVNFLQEFDNMGYLPYFQYVKERSSYKLTAVGHDFSSFSLRSTTN